MDQNINKMSVKAAVAVAAVLAYIKSEEEAILTATMPAEVLPEQTRQAPRSGVWALNGRQTQMQMRSMMQMKAFHSSRL